jgi:hypothetical protein
MHLQVAGDRLCPTRPYTNRCRLHRVDSIVLCCMSLSSPHNPPPSSISYKPDSYTCEILNLSSQFCSDLMGPLHPCRLVHPCLLTLSLRSSAFYNSYSSCLLSCCLFFLLHPLEPTRPSSSPYYGIYQGCSRKAKRKTENEKVV